MAEVLLVDKNKMAEVLLVDKNKMAEVDKKNKMANYKMTNF